MENENKLTFLLTDAWCLTLVRVAGGQAPPAWLWPSQHPLLSEPRARSCELHSGPGQSRGSRREGCLSPLQSGEGTLHMGRSPGDTCLGRKKASVCRLPESSPSSRPSTNGLAEKGRPPSLGPETTPHAVNTCQTVGQPQSLDEDQKFMASARRWQKGKRERTGEAAGWGQGCCSHPEGGLPVLTPAQRCRNCP